MTIKTVAISVFFVFNMIMMMTTTTTVFALPIPPYITSTAIDSQGRPCGKYSEDACIVRRQYSGDPTITLKWISNGDFVAAKAAMSFVFKKMETNDNLNAVLKVVDGGFRWVIWDRWVEDEIEAIKSGYLATFFFIMPEIVTPVSLIMNPFGEKLNYPKGKYIMRWRIIYEIGANSSGRMRYGDVVSYIFLNLQ